MEQKTTKQIVISQSKYAELRNIGKKNAQLYVKDNIDENISWIRKDDIIKALEKHLKDDKSDCIGAIIAELKEG